MSLLRAAAACQFCCSGATVLIDKTSHFHIETWLDQNITNISKNNFQYTLIVLILMIKNAYIYLRSKVSLRNIIEQAVFYVDKLHFAFHIHAKIFNKFCISFNTVYVQLRKISNFWFNVIYIWMFQIMIYLGDEMNIHCYASLSSICTCIQNIDTVTKHLVWTYELFENSRSDFADNITAMTFNWKWKVQRLISKLIITIKPLSSPMNAVGNAVIIWTSVHELFGMQIEMQICSFQI